MPKVPLKSFIEFARTKPSDEDFDPDDVTNCALAQFGMAYLKIGNRTLISAGSARFTDLTDFGVYTIDADHDRLWDAIFNTRNWGALTARLEALDVNN